MSVRRLAAAGLLLAALVLAALTLVLLVDNPDVPGRGWGDDGTYQCLAPWDTALNGADNSPGGEPPPDAEVIAARCRHVGYQRYDAATLAGAGAVAALAAVAVVGLTRRRGLVVGLVAPALAVACVAGVAGAGWKKRHPTAFDDSGAELSFDALPARKTVYAGVNWPGSPDGDVTVEAARPMVTRDTAHSSVEVVVCVPRAGADPIGSVDAREVDDFCAELVPIRWDAPPARLASARRDQLLIKLTTYAPGAVDVAGVELVYRDGWRHGRQEVGARVTATTPASSK